jgi:hypothetical protein
MRKLFSIFLPKWHAIIQQTYLQVGESGVGRTEGGCKFPELTFQSRTHLSTSMSVIESTRVANFSYSTRVQNEKWLQSLTNSPNDSTRTRLADFCGKWLESTQLQLVQNKFIKIIVIVLLGKNNEPCETLSDNIWGLHRIYSRRACLYYISVFRNNASATVFKMDSQNFLYLQYTNSDRLFSFLVFMKCYIITKRD